MKQESIFDRIEKIISPSDVHTVQCTPIKLLTPFDFDWKIKARVTKKHPKKAWKNDKSSGYLLNMELIDSFDTQIVSTLFNEIADKWDKAL